MKIIELPEPDLSIQDGCDKYGYPDYVHGYTADQMRDHAEAVRLATIEECAKEAERVTWYEGSKQRAPAHDTVWHAARAIRALGESK